MSSAGRLSVGVLDSAPDPEKVVVWHTDTGKDYHDSTAAQNTGVLRRGHLAADLNTENSRTDDDSAPLKKTKLAFGVDDRPPIHIATFYALQIILSNLPGTVTAVFIIHKIVCGGRDYVFLAQLMSAAVAMTGVATFLQVSIGVRLPIAQGSSFVFFPPIVAMMSSKNAVCMSDGATNATEGIHGNVSSPGDPAWKSPLLEASGGLIVASLVQVLLGCTGIVGLLMNFIGPLTIAPTIILIGFCLFTYGVDSGQHQWGVTFLFIILLVLFSTVLADVQVPMVTWSRKKGFHVERYPLIRMFANLLAIGICWLLCYILTVTGRLPDDPDAVGFLARTDAKTDAITKTTWFYFPYPGHFGMPRFGAGVFVGLLAATFSSIVESIGDYYATARITELPPPPKHAMNRGIAMEGFASMLSGLVGTCHGTTSYSNIVGFIAYTGVASRWTMIIMSVILFVCAVFGKLAGALATIPEPIIGGAITVGLGLVILVGMSQLHAVDLEATRNQMALGLALMLGVMMPYYVEKNPDVINTSIPVLDQVLVVFLSTGPFIGGLVGLVMDNILPGTKEERGMTSTLAATGKYITTDPDRIRKVYELPFCTAPLRRYRVFEYVPFLPCYVDKPWPCKTSRCCRKDSYTVDGVVPSQTANSDTIATDSKTTVI